jgi:hypothetical protein
MRVIVARSNSFVPPKCKNQSTLFFIIDLRKLPGRVSMEISAKQCLLDFVWLALPFAGMVAFRRFLLSGAEFTANRRFQFQKRRQLFIRVHNKTLPVVTMCVHNPDRSPVGINR